MIRTEKWKVNYIRKNHDKMTALKMADDLGISAKAVYNICREYKLNPLNTKTIISNDMKAFLKENIGKMPLTELSKVTGLTLDQLKNFIQRNKHRPKSEKELLKEHIHHMYNLCMFLLCGYTIRGMCKDMGMKGHTEDDCLEALNYKEGILLKFAYSNILGNKNKIKIREHGKIGLMLHEFCMDKRHQKTNVG